MLYSSQKPSQSPPCPTILALLLYLCLFQAFSATILIPDFDLNSAPLDPALTGFTMIGNAALDDFGYSVSTVGDINGDGYDDLIIGAPRKNVNQGAAYVIYGGPTSSISDIPLATTVLDPKTTGFTISTSALGQFGLSVSRAGDIDNDGYDDIIIGSPVNSNKGAAFVIYGGESSTRSDIDFSTVTLDPLTTGFIVTANANNDGLGTSVGPAGDIDGDGFDDIIIGATFKGSFQGIVYVIYGGKRNTRSNINLAVDLLIPSSTGFSMRGKLAWDYFGNSARTAGDLNGDGFDDIVIGAYGENGSQGAVYVVYGGPKSSMRNIDLGSDILNPASTGFKITGVAANDRFGRVVDTAGDVNNDGYADILIGAPNRNFARGAAYVIYGKKNPSNIDLSGGLTTLDPATTGFTILGGLGVGQLGTSVSTAGDVNGDGYADIIVGAYGYGGYLGAAYVIYGGDSSLMSNLDFISATALDNSAKGFRITGVTMTDWLGHSVRTAGDINGDGYSDIIVGAYNRGGQQGEVYVFHGACVPTIPGSPCAVRNFCQTCLDGKSLSSPHCQSCSQNCLQYNAADKSCQICEIGYALENSQCESCPAHCSSCITSGDCQICETGYLVSGAGSPCLLPSPIKEEKETNGWKILSNVLSLLGSAICLGRSIFLTQGLISKIVQYTRYLDLIVSNDLKEIYSDWNTEILSISFPNSLSHLLNFKELPLVYARYDMDSAFLANFWSNLLTFGGGLGVFAVSKALKAFFLKSKEGGRFQDWTGKVIAGSVNYMIVQIYGCVDDILFYFVLDARTNRFNSHFSRTSLFFGIVFGLCGGLLLGYNFWIVRKYQEVKTKDSAQVENFKEKNKLWELFYSDFSDNDFWSHSFLGFLVARNTLASLTIATLFESPVLQTITLLLTDVFIIVYMLVNKPFPRLQDKISQGLFEIIALVVHISTLILSVQEEGSPENLSKTIIYSNTAMMVGTLGFMLLEICKTIGEKIRDWVSKLKKQTEKSKVYPVTEGDSSRIQSLPTNPIKPTHLLTSDRVTGNKKWINLDGDSFRRNLNRNYGMSDSRVNLVMQNSQVSLNGDQEIDTSRYLNNNNNTFRRGGEDLQGVGEGRRVLRVRKRNTTGNNGFMN